MSIDLPLPALAIITANLFVSVKSLIDVLSIEVSSQITPSGT
ncbi:MAG: hypothetical protein ABWZ66_06855 [Pyrinomonadaceae bacterium]